MQVHCSSLDSYPSSNLSLNFADSVSNFASHANADSNVAATAIRTRNIATAFQVSQLGPKMDATRQNLD